MKSLNFLKLIASELLCKLNFIFLPKEYKIMITDLKEKGYYIIDNFLTKEVCNELILETDLLLKKNEFVSIESNGSDSRIYGVDLLSKKFLIDKIDTLNARIHEMAHFFSDRLFFILLGKITHQEGNKGSGTGWHRDSPFRHQFKTIVYLCDVDENNGPFQYIEKSHKASSLFKVSNKLKKPLNEDRFTNDEISGVLGDNNDLITFCAKAGTLILVDTRGLHRGKPLISDDRYAITTYNYNKRLPKSIVNLPLFKK